MQANIYELTKNLIKEYGTNDPYELADVLDITVKYRHFNNLKGMYKVIENTCFIWLNDSLDEYTESVVLMHEIGHHILHRRLAINSFQEFSLYDMKGIPEIEANEFAANMLISDRDMVELAEQGYTSAQAASILCMPHQLVLIKVQDMIDRGFAFCLNEQIRYDFLGF